MATLADECFEPTFSQRFLQVEGNLASNRAMPARSEDRQNLCSPHPRGELKVYEDASHWLLRTCPCEQPEPEVEIPGAGYIVVPLRILWPTRMDQDRASRCSEHFGRNAA